MLLETKEQECWSWGGCWRKLLELGWVLEKVAGAAGAYQAL